MRRSWQTLADLSAGHGPTSSSLHLSSYPFAVQFYHQFASQLNRNFTMDRDPNQQPRPMSMAMPVNVRDDARVAHSLQMSHNPEVRSSPDDARDESSMNLGNGHEGMKPMKRACNDCRQQKVSFLYISISIFSRFNGSANVIETASLRCCSIPVRAVLPLPETREAMHR